MRHSVVSCHIFRFKPVEQINAKKQDDDVIAAAADDDDDAPSS